MDSYQTPTSFGPPPPLPPAPLGPPYPLRVWHFFLWTFASALVAGITRRPDYMRELDPGSERSYLILAGVYALIAGPFLAAGLWFFGIAVPRRLYFRAWPSSRLGSQPGHWLLLIGGLETLGGFVFYFCSAWRGSQADAVLVIWGGAYLVGLILTFYAWNRCTKERSFTPPWRVLFYSGAAARILCCVCNPWLSPLMLLAGRLALLRGASVQSGDMTTIFVGGVGLLLLGAAAIWDLVRKARRDTMHWLGVVATLGLLLYPFLWGLLLPLQI